MVRVTDIGLREKGFDQGSLGIVFRAEAALFLYDFSFGLELIAVQDKALHPVRLQFQREGQAIGRQVFEIGGEILAGKRIIHPAVLSDQAGE